MVIWWWFNGDLVKGGEIYGHQSQDTTTSSKIVPV
jgi:hypothetical protein